MEPSLYARLSPEQKRKSVRYFVGLIVLAPIAVALFQFESRHWSLQILLIFALLGQIVLFVKLLNAITINPKKRSPPDDDSQPTP